MVESSNCAGDLQSQIGSPTSCDVTGGGGSAEYGVTVTSIDGGLINVSIAQV